MIQAIWNGAVLAESDQTIVVEGNHYFPPESVKKEYFIKSDKHTFCGWKGQSLSKQSLRINQEGSRLS